MDEKYISTDLTDEWVSMFIDPNNRKGFMYEFAKNTGELPLGVNPNDERVKKILGGEVRT